MAVTEEEVVWCYRSILGRNSETAEAILQHASSTKDFRSLVLRFINSKEFRKKGPPPVLVPLDRAEMDLDITASAADLSALRDRIREAWTHLGLVRPHHSVLTHKDYLPGAINEDSVERFYASGVAEVQRISAILRRYGFAHPESKTCVEYGCGLGRVTIALAAVFKKVHGYDISPNHLALAEKYAADKGIRNVKFHQSPDVVGGDLEDCDFFYSNIVFQHNPPPLIRKLIGSSLRSLRVGGVGIFQVPTYGTGYSFRIKEYLARPPTRDMEMHCIPQAEVFSLIADEQCKVLEVREDSSIARLGQWISNTFVVRRTARPSRGKR